MSARALLQPLSSEQEATSIVERFHSVAARNAYRTAVVCGKRQLTYAELERHTRQLAAHLVSRGVGPECRVGLCVERSVEMIVAILAILEAGGAYVPLPPAYPAERLEYLVNDARPTVILHDGSCSSLVSALGPRCGASCLSLDDCTDEEGSTPGTRGRVRLWPDNVAYVIYTSGSTGGPKGSHVTHRNVLRLFTATETAFEFGNEDVWPLLHSYAFDFSVWEIFGALLHGGKLVIPTSDEVSDPARLLSFLVRHDVTVLNQTPSFFHRFCQFLEKAPALERAGLRPSFIVFGGERLSFGMLGRWFDLMGDEAVLVNMYGITETTVHVTLYPVSRADAEREQASIIGAPIGDLRLHLLDEHLRPVPRGATGELFVEGPGLTRGYHDRPRQTAEAFIPCPFAETPGQRMYRTGDLARVDGEGRLVYLERKGGFVKIRGFRVSLAEVEAALQTCDGIEEAVVLTRDHEGSSELDAWVVGATATLTPSDLRRQLSEKVPAFFIPHRFLQIDALPLTPNGKIDHSKLRLSGRRLVDDHSNETAATEAEAGMLAVWQEAMNQESLTVKDDFFASGGDSIRAVELVVALRRAGWNATVQDVWQAPTVRDLAARIGHAAAAEAAGVATASDESAIASDMQTIMLDRYARHAHAGNGVYHTQQSFTLGDRELDLELLVRCFQVECAVDPSFRTRFGATDTGFIRVRDAQAPPVDIRQLDLSSLEGDAQAAHLAAHEQEDIRCTFEPTSGRSPLTRIALFRLSDTSVRIFVSAHHAIDDGWGRQRFLKRVLDAYRSGQVPESSGRTDPYDQYVALQRRSVEDPEAAQYWERHAIAPDSLLPVDRPVPMSIQEHRCALSTVTVHRVLEEARQARVQAKALFLAAVLEAISEATGMESVTLGMVVNGRLAELPETMNANGLYWNMHPFTWSNAASATKSVNDIHERLTRQARYALFPLSTILARQGAGKEFRFTFNYTSFPPIGEDSRLKMRDWRGLDSFHYPINVGVHLDLETAEHEIRITCDPSLCPTDMSRRLLEATQRSIEMVGAAGASRGEPRA